MNRRIALAGFVLALVVAAVLRFYLIDLRPLHHDEGVNALFLRKLVREGHYSYDPTNYHGPLLYYMVALVLKLFGESTFWLRFWPAALGVITIALLWPVRRWIGSLGVVVAAWLVALSPISVYFSRDLIHESWYACAGALMVAGAARWSDQRRTSAAVMMWVGAACLFATKETAPILLAALVGGVIVAALTAHGARGLGAVVAAQRAGREAHALGVLAAVAILFLLFTSFTTNLDGFLDMFRAYRFWAKTGTGVTGHEKPWPYFVELLWRYERVTSALAVAGLIVAALRREVALALGVAALLFVVAHSIIPYKTPWLVLGVLPLLAASSGYAVDRALASRRPAIASWALRAAIVPLLLWQLSSLGLEAHRLSFIDYDDNEREAFVYSQTRRGFLELVSAVRAAAEAGPLGRDTPITVLSADHFPLNWYVRDMGKVGYPGPSGTARDHDILMLPAADGLGFLRRDVSIAYRTREFPLRPGVELMLAIPDELFVAAGPAITAPGLWRRVVPRGRLAPLPVAAVPRDLGVGLLARTVPGADFARASGVAVAGIPILVDSDRERPTWSVPHGIEWSGLLLAGAEGKYQFSLESDDGSELELGGDVVIDNRGAHSLLRREGTVELGAGYHRIRIRYDDIGGGAKLFFRWRPPRAALEESVPEEVLWHDPRALGADHGNERPRDRVE